MNYEKLIIICSVCLIAIFSSFMFVYSKTLQRTADDLVKINAGGGSDIEKRFKDCIFNTAARDIDVCNKIKELK